MSDPPFIVFGVNETLNNGAGLGTYLRRQVGHCFCREGAAGARQLIARPFNYNRRWFELSQPREQHFEGAPP